jgi:hypothetical protein
MPALSVSRGIGGEISAGRALDEAGVADDAGEAGDTGSEASAGGGFVAGAVGGSVGEFVEARAVPVSAASSDATSADIKRARARRMRPWCADRAKLARYEVAKWVCAVTGSEAGPSGRGAVIDLDQAPLRCV